jgi:hypothetical protein
MSDISPVIEQARLFVDQHVQPEWLSQAVPLALICLVAGIGMSVLGTKMSRLAMGLGFVVLGGVAGAFFGREFVFPLPVCIVTGAVMIGAIGHLTYRLWVGVAAAVVLSSLALGAFGYQRILPHVPEFREEAMVGWSPVEGPVQFALPSPEQQQEYLAESPKRWAQNLWAHVTVRDAQVERHGKALALVALLTGLCLGVVAVRWALILTTSLVGTALVTTAAATLFAHATPESYQSFADHPGMVGVGVGGFLATSLIVQTLLTRQAPAKLVEPAPASKNE